MADYLDSDKNDITLMSIVDGIDDIYKNFENEMTNLLANRKGRRAVLDLAHLFTGTHASTDKDVILDRFINDMNKHLEILDQALDGLDQESVSKACASVVLKTSQTVPANSNSIVDLMKRAMIRAAIKYLPNLSKDELIDAKNRVSKAYPKWNRLPVEKEFLKEIDKLLS